jgi:hypothetical protein
VANLFYDHKNIRPLMKEKFKQDKKDTDNNNNNNKNNDIDEKSIKNVVFFSNINTPTTFEERLNDSFNYWDDFSKINNIPRDNQSPKDRKYDTPAPSDSGNKFVF